MSPGHRPLPVDPRPIGRAAPRLLVIHDLRSVRRPEDGRPADSVRLARHQQAFTLARLARKSHRITPEPPYNPHNIAAAQPRGIVQQGLSALSECRRSSNRPRQCG